VTEVDVFDGLVEVAAPTILGSSVLVSPGFSTRVGMGTAPESPVPTREIRPDVEASNDGAKQEFARERASQAGRTWDSELGERPDSELDDSRLARGCFLSGSCSSARIGIPFAPASIVISISISISCVFSESRISSQARP
jgi:hypothetical protein